MRKGVLTVFAEFRKTSFARELPARLAVLL
jgi:hypothetical protein